MRVECLRNEFRLLCDVMCASDVLHRAIYQFMSDWLWNTFFQIQYFERLDTHVPYGRSNRIFNECYFYCWPFRWFSHSYSMKLNQTNAFYCSIVENKKLYFTSLTACLAFNAENYLGMGKTLTRFLVRQRDERRNEKKNIGIFEWSNIENICCVNISIRFFVWFLYKTRGDDSDNAFSKAYTFDNANEMLVKTKSSPT